MHGQCSSYLQLQTDGVVLWRDLTKLEVPRLTFLGRERTQASAVEGEDSSKELFE